LYNIQNVVGIYRKIGRDSRKNW